MLSATKDRKMITLPEVKKLLETLDEETADQIQRRTLDYVSKFAKLPAEESIIIRERLVNEANLSEREAVEITNILPKSKEELRVFTSGWKKLLPEETMDKILEVLKR
jgi:DNA-directed RNA polymerase subunit F